MIFSVDYWAIANDKILDIHKYLMKKNNIKCLNLFKKCFFTAITFFRDNVLNLNSLKCVSMNNQKCKIRSKIMLTLMNLCFICRVLQIRAKVVVILLMTHMLSYVFLILLKP